MKTFLLAALLALPFVAVAADKHDAAATKKDVERHRKIAAAHEAAARCLESGKDADSCQKALQDACKGLAIGKYCGMKHEH
jgi:hypothetical protein